MRGAQEELDVFQDPAEYSVSVHEERGHQGAQSFQEGQVGSDSGAIHAVQAPPRPHAGLPLGTKELRVGAKVPIVVESHQGG